MPINWYSINITSLQFAQGFHFPLQDHFQKIYAALNAPVDAALFAKDALMGSAVYLVAVSPRVEQSFKPFLTVYGAVSCEAPENSDDIGLLVGRDDASWKLIR